MIVTIIVALLHGSCETTIKTESNNCDVTDWPQKYHCFYLSLVNVFIFWRHDLACYHLAFLIFYNILFFDFWEYMIDRTLPQRKKINETKIFVCLLWHYYDQTLKKTTVLSSNSYQKHISWKTNEKLRIKIITGACSNGYINYESKSP